MAQRGSDDAADIREMAEIAERLAKRMNRSFILDEQKVQAYQDHNRAGPIQPAKSSKSSSFSS